jgi:hypothetical protein
VGDVVAGVHDEVRLQVGEATYPALLAGLLRHQVQVGHVQDPQGPAPGGQHRHLETAQDVRLPLDARGVPEAEGADGDAGQQEAGSGRTGTGFHIRVRDLRHV